MRGKQGITQHIIIHNMHMIHSVRDHLVESSSTIHYSSVDIQCMEENVSILL